MTPPIQRLRAFTLLEILVCIGIICTLAVITITGVQDWQHRSNTLACTNNLRQLSLYLTNYAQDHNGVYPAAHDMTTSDSWMLTLQNYINLPNENVAIGKRTIFVCPEAFFTYPHGVVCRTYSMNCEGISDWRIPTRQSANTHPSQTIYLIDASADPADDGDPNFYFRANTFASCYEARHFGKLNSLFLDGHVQALSPTDTNTMTYIQNLGK